MKLKDSFMTQDIDDTQFLVPVGAEAFSGVVRSNKTAAFIVNCMKKDAEAPLVKITRKPKATARRQNSPRQPQKLGTK